MYSDIAIEVPPMGESIEEGSIAAILKAPGDAVEVDEVIAQIETDKVTIDVRSPEAGAIAEILVAEEDTVTVGQAVAKLTVGASGKASAAPAAAAAAVETKEATTAPPTAPVVEAPPAKKAVAKAAAAATPLPVAAEGNRVERRVPMTRLRRRVSERLKASQNTYAMLTTYNEIDMSNIMELRTEYKDLFLERHGVKLGFMSAFIKAATYALNELPVVNGVIDGDDILYRDYVDISIAVGTPKGLVVPVLRNVEQMTFADVEKTIGSLGKRAREGQLGIDDMTGGTFTISNGGVYGSLLSSPIINMPQSAILGMHSIVNRPVAVGKEIKLRPMMYVALSYDHRLIDGREAVTFLKRIKEVVEDPRRILLDV